MSIKLKGSTDGSVTLQAPADTSPTGTDKTFTLPTQDGDAGQILKTDGSGALSFTDNLASGRNLVINGSFQVAQRSTSRVFGDGYLALDRWATGQFQQAGHEYVSVSDSTVPTKSAIRVTSSPTSENASGTRMAVGQMIEAVNCAHLPGKKVTLSFYIRFSSATFTGYGNFTYNLNEFDTTANPDFSTTGATRANSETLTNGSLPTTWTKYTKTITCGSAMKNLAPRFLFLDLANTTNASDLWYEVAAVQVEEGEVATKFEHRNYGDELARCHRYYWQQNATSNYTRYGIVSVESATTAETVIHLPTTMRIPPALLHGTIGNSVIYSALGLYVSTALAMDNTSANAVCIGISSSGMTGGRAGTFLSNNTTNFYLGFDAEL